MTNKMLKWNIYLCRYVMECIYEKTNKKEIYIEAVLFESKSVDAAYAKAQDEIEVRSDRYRDDYGNIIALRCLGINNLSLLETTWNELIENSKKDYGYTLDVLEYENFTAESLLKEKSELEVFQDYTKKTS